MPRCRLPTPLGKTGRRLDYAADIGARPLGTRDARRYKTRTTEQGEEDMTKHIRAALALAAAALLPMACSEAPEQAETAPEAPEGVSVTNARLMLPAVAGNPGAVYFDIANASERNRVIRAVSVAGAGSA